MTAPAPTKVCSRCGSEYPMAEFPTNVSGKGYVSARTWCQKCENKRGRDKAKKNKKMRARRDERVRAWRSTPTPNGKVQKMPCEVCGAPKVEAHHEDYSKPLDVRWLCPDHHKQAHGQLP